MPWTLPQADQFAARIREELAPFCDRIEIAGSIRRRRPFVNDVDLVVLPNPAREIALRERCKLKARSVNIDGPQTLVVTLHNNLQVDVWFAHAEIPDLVEPTPCNFGTLLLCRTGSREHNIFLVQHAKTLGKNWNPYHGVFDSHGGPKRCVAAESEEAVFRALELEFIPPEKRER